jgi:hypothetical protein
MTSLSFLFEKTLEPCQSYSEHFHNSPLLEPWGQYIRTVTDGKRKEEL